MMCNNCGETFDTRDKWEYFYHEEALCDEAVIIDTTTSTQIDEKGDDFKKVFLIWLIVFVVALALVGGALI